MGNREKKETTLIGHSLMIRCIMVDVFVYTLYISFKNTTISESSTNNTVFLFPLDAIEKQLLWSKCPVLV